MENTNNMYFFKTINYKNLDVCIYKNAPADNKDYSLVLTENKNNKYYIKSAMLDNLDTQDFKNSFVKDLYFYKTVVIENYYNIYKNLKVDVYKDIPYEELKKLRQYNTLFQWLLLHTQRCVY